MRRTLRTWLLSTLLIPGCAPEENEVAETDAAARDEEDDESGDESGTDTEAPPEGGRRIEDEASEGVRQLPCGADGSQSYATGDTCFCFSGFTWCDPDNERSLLCCAEGSESEVRCDSNAEMVDGGCRCTDGYTWCSSDPESVSCCPVMDE